MVQQNGRGHLQQTGNFTANGKQFVTTLRRAPSGKPTITPGNKADKATMGGDVASVAQVVGKAGVEIAEGAALAGAAGEILGFFGMGLSLFGIASNVV